MRKRSATKRKPANRIKDKKTTAPQKTSRSIPKNILEDFTGHVRNLYKIDAVHLWDDYFRVNVWTETWEENDVGPKYAIDKSFFMCYDGVELVDKTITKQKENK